MAVVSGGVRRASSRPDAVVSIISTPSLPPAPLKNHSTPSSGSSPFSVLVCEVGGRLRTHWVIKTLGITGGIPAFFLLYFYVLRHPIFPVTIMPLTAVDRLIGFRPEALPLYLSLWVYIPLAFVLQQDRRGLWSSGVAAILLSGAGLGIFFVWPTAVPDLGVDWSLHPSVAFLKEIDAAGNACPSLHVAFAVWAAFHVGALLREMRAHASVQVANWLWCLAIVYSTIATGQHVAVDALTGVVLGAAAAIPIWIRRR